jgi:hypothetical protein
MSLKKFKKDPNAVLDYTIDWSEWLADADTITAATSTPDTGINVDSTMFTINTTTTWVSGGTNGTTYNIVIHVTTNGGREDDRTIQIEVKDQ